MASMRPLSESSRPGRALCNDSKYFVTIKSGDAAVIDSFTIAAASVVCTNTRASTLGKLNLDHKNADIGKDQTLSKYMRASFHVSFINGEESSISSMHKRSQPLYLRKEKR